MSDEPKRLERVLTWIVLAMLVAGCTLVLLPFISAILWAGVLSFSAWPVYQRVLGWVGGRRTIAASIMTLAATLVLLLPFLLVGVTLADNINDFNDAWHKWMAHGLPDAPAWLARIPLVGAQATERWQEFAGDSKKFIVLVQQYLQPASAWFLSGGLKLGAGLIELTMSILLAFFFYRDGGEIVDRLRSGAKRLWGERGHRLLGLAGDTIRSVVYGILGTAIAQGVMAGIGFLIAGVPGSALLALLTFFLSVVPMGPPLIWLPAAIWLFNQGHSGWGIFMLIWGTGVSSIDNILKPWLISKGSDMPFILILFGVFGGVLAFGFIGIFLGPTLLAVGYCLLAEWIVISKQAAGEKPVEKPATTPE